MAKEKMKVRLCFNAPLILSFVAVCVLAQIADIVTEGAANRAVFSVYRSGRFGIMTVVRCFTHVIGHADWEHLIGNMLYILVVGPLLEDKYGAARLGCVMLLTAGVTGLLSMLFFPDSYMLGASGIVFAMLLLSTITCRTTLEDGTRVIPVTFLLVAALYLGQQVYDGLFTPDSVAQWAHIAGGAIGSVLGFIMNKHDSKINERRTI